MKFVRLFCSLLLLAFLPLSANAIWAWQDVGPGKYNFMGQGGNRALAIDASGNIYVTGYYLNASNQHFVAKWNGSGWSELGAGGFALNANGDILAITTDAAGNVYAAGNFINPVRQNRYVAKWDGTTWREIRNDTSYLKANGRIWSVAVDVSGNVYAAGQFTDSIGSWIGHSYVAKWDGKKWEPLGGSAPLQANSPISSIACDVKGNVYAVGAFSNVTGHPYVAKWDGIAWSELGNLPDNTPASLSGLNTVTTDTMGNVYTAGSIGGTGGSYVARWNGTAWSEVGSAASPLWATGDINSIVVTPNGSDVYAAGTFTNSPGNTYVAHWDGKTWSELGAAPYTINQSGNGDVSAIAINSTGNVFAAGSFKNKAGICYVARYGQYNLAVPDGMRAGTLQVYPNPSNGHFTIRGESATAGQRLTITLCDMLGRVVYSTELQASGVAWSVEVPAGSRLPDGIYQLQLSSGDSRYACSLVVRGGE